MVFILRESEAIKTVFKHKNVAAFSLSKKLKRGFSENELELSYDNNTFVPDEDTINSVIDGSVKPKKVIKNAIKQFRNPAKAEDRKSVMAATVIMNLITDPKKNNIVVFVLDDETKTEEELAREKFIIKFVKAICKEFGIEPITKVKGPLKKVFKTKDKWNLKKIYKVVGKKYEKWLRSGKSKSYGPSRKTVVYTKRLITFFATELHQMGLKDKDPDALSSRERRDLARSLYQVFSNENMRRICEVSKKKEGEKLCKYLRKKNKLAFDTYELTRNVLEEMSDAKLPKAKFGYPDKKKLKKKFKKLDAKREKLDEKLKKAKKKGKKKEKKEIKKKLGKVESKMKKISKINLDKPLLKEDKFVDKLSKYKNRNLLSLMYMNIAYVHLTGEKMDTDEWNSGFKKYISEYFGKEFASKFVGAVSAYLKADDESSKK